MRIALIGEIGDGGGVPSLNRLLLEGLVEEGVHVDYFAADTVPVPECVRLRDNFRLFQAATWWRWDRWYSRRPMFAFASGMYSRVQTHARLARALLRENRRQPYDCILQLSQSELFTLGNHLRELPPVVVFPFVHAAGELRWHRRESHFALRSESASMHYAVRCLLLLRSAIQRREFNKPACVLGLSRRFNQLVSRDYGVPSDRMKVVYHPIRFPADNPAPADADRTPRDRVKLLFVGRISVRKGIEQVIELSRRLDDLHGQIDIEVVGNRSQWSDYTAHLARLNPRTARYRGQVGFADISNLYAAADILLVPSMYEPGGLVVGEALSNGVAVVASDEVGSAEPIDPGCCRRFPAGDLDAFETATRRLVLDVRHHGPQLRREASREARRHFAPSAVLPRLVSAIREVAGAARN
jgi:glycosyltransferase involved in cell wall biosynthesis